MIFQSHDYHQILENLYLGNVNASKLYHNNFDLIVNCTIDMPIYNFDKTIRLPINDEPSNDNVLSYVLRNSTLLATIHKYIINNKKVLIHCQAGISRSCTVTACYLIKYYKYNQQSAINYIKQRRPIAFYLGINFKNTLDNIFVSSI